MFRIHFTRWLEPMYWNTLERHWVGAGINYWHFMVDLKGWTFPFSHKRQQGTATVPVLWNWTNSTILEHFVTQNFCLHELWNLHSFRICPQAYLTHRLWEIWNTSTQSWEIAIQRKQDWSIFAWFWGKMRKITQKCSNLASWKLQFLKIGLMYFRFLKACGSGRLVGIF